MSARRPLALLMLVAFLAAGSLHAAHAICFTTLAEVFLAEDTCCARSGCAGDGQPDQQPCGDDGKECPKACCTMGDADSRFLLLLRPAMEPNAASSPPAAGLTGHLHLRPPLDPQAMPPPEPPMLRSRLPLHLLHQVFLC